MKDRQVYQDGVTFAALHFRDKKLKGGESSTHNPYYPLFYGPYEVMNRDQRSEWRNNRELVEFYSRMNDWQEGYLYGIVYLAQTIGGNR